MLEVHVVPVSWSSHKESLRHIRQTVFVEEQNIPAEVEFDAEDDQATHLLALDSAGTPLGCARLLDSGVIGRVAVMIDARGTGLGKALMQATVDEAINKKLTRLSLHAQENAQGFYRKLDFVATGQRFKEAGIEHVTMERVLPIPFETQGLKKSVVIRDNPRDETSAQQTQQQAAAMRESRLLEFTSEAAAISQLDAVIESANRQLRLYSPTLDHTLFDRAPLVELMSKFVRSAPGAQVEILVNDTALIVARGHLLVELRRRLDEKMIIRKLPDTIKGDKQSWLVADNTALWVQSEPNEYRGWSDTFNPVQAERFTKRYTHLWDRSVSDPELRVLRGF